MTTEECRARIDEIDAIIEPLKSERRALWQKIIASKSEFKIGDIIEWQSGKTTAKGRVVKIIEWVCGDPQWTVRRILKNGNEGEECDVPPYKNPNRVKG